MTPQQIIGQIRLVIGADPAIPDEELPKLIKSAMSRREADGIVEGRRLEMERWAR